VLRNQRGTVVVTGRAAAVVVATGNRTESGRTAQASEGNAPPTGVQTRLGALARSTARFSIGAGLGLLAVDLTRGQGVAHALGRAVNPAVASVPEGLPFVATVAELAAARRLATCGVLTRNPSTIEALGRVDMVCFDKTGTLTEGRISVAAVSDGAESRRVDELTPPLRQVLAAAALASPWHSPEHEVAHQTDRAVLQEARRLGVSPEQGDASVAALAERPFESGLGRLSERRRCPGNPLCRGLLALAAAVAASEVVVLTPAGSERLRVQRPRLALLLVMNLSRVLSPRYREHNRALAALGGPQP
jgi:cation-transporting ATPase I